MAVNTTIPVASSDYMAMPLSIKRGNPNPLDTSDLYASLTDAQDYAKNDPTAYVGQIISTVVESTNNEGSTVFEVKLYQIVDTDGTLLEIGGGIEAVFDDERWTELKDIVDKLNGDETIEGSIKYVYDQSKVTMELDSSTGANIYTFYQGTHKENRPVFEDDGETPVLDEEGVPLSEEVIVPTKIGTISIFDQFVDKASVVDVEKVEDSDTGDISYIDSEGDIPLSGITKGCYLKLVMVSGDKVYIATEKLTTGLIREIKLDGFSFTADTDGAVDITEVPVNLLYQGDTTLILLGGDSTI